MKREEIEKAARMFSCETKTDAEGVFYRQKGFKAGAEWRINSVWHSSNEVARRKPALVEYSHIDGNFGYLVVEDAASLGDAIRRWAYIEDLLP